MANDFNLNLNRTRFIRMLVNQEVIYSFYFALYAGF